MILPTNKLACFIMNRKLALKYSDGEFQIFWFNTYMNQVSDYRLSRASVFFYQFYFLKFFANYENKAYTVLDKHYFKIYFSEDGHHN